MLNELKVTLPQEVPVEEARLLLMIKLFETGRLSLGQAARLSGHSKRAFMEMLGKSGVAVFDQPAEELEEALDDSVRRIKARRILGLAHSGLWQGDLAVMRNDQNTADGSR